MKTVDRTEGFFEIGVVSGAHGIGGFVRAHVYTASPENICEQPFIYCDGKKTVIEKCGIHGRELLIKFKGIDNRDEAAAMKGCLLSIDRTKGARLLEGEYYIQDLIGCSVYEDSKKLGFISDVIETGANDVYVIEDGQGHEVLIPAIDSVVLNIDIGNRKISVRLPEGIDDNDYI